MDAPRSADEARASRMAPQLQVSGLELRAMATGTALHPWKLHGMQPLSVRVVRASGGNLRQQPPLQRSLAQVLMSTLPS